jgi:hypothetical protein
MTHGRATSSTRSEQQKNCKSRRYGATGSCGIRVTIWVVRHGDDLYVRSAYGRTSSWFRGTQDRHEGHICAGGVDKDVLFVEADDDVNDQIDAAYRTKYRRYSARYVNPIVSPEARAATIKLVPGSTSRATEADR